MDPAQIIALHKIDDAIKDGAFDNLPHHERIECSLQGEYFVAWWWREKIKRDEHFRPT
jgi:hypothetical protein